MPDGDNYLYWRKKIRTERKKRKVQVFKYGTFIADSFELVYLKPEVIDLIDGFAHGRRNLDRGSPGKLPEESVSWWDIRLKAGFLFQSMAMLIITTVEASTPTPPRFLQHANDEFLLEQAKPETVEKVCKIVKKQLALPAETCVTGESTFSGLGADSLDTVEIVMGLEEAFGISVEEESAQNITTVQDAADLIEKLAEAKSN
ncbi:hypothetical protein HPP92_003152 [Vanilla planifolia]|uniref:Acyl carrier protein n=1 Tax=Vanilla planifolia TaxID=51239 RepID=A0A835VJ53_VANPL|nr:hypothetical protein HPP92_003152 [Vanilla planifolia]